MGLEIADEVTRLLRAIEGGDAAASARLMPLVYDELRRLAGAKLAQEPQHHTLQPTALVHEAFSNLVGAGGPWKDRTHFLSAAALAMRRVLVDHARRRRMDKRGGAAVKISLHEDHADGDAREVELVVLDEALASLEAQDTRLAHVVMLRCLGGLEMQEIAQVLGVSPATVKRDWVFARAWLRSRLTAAT